MQLQLKRKERALEAVTQAKAVRKAAVEAEKAKSLTRRTSVFALRRSADRASARERQKKLPPCSKAGCPNRASLPRRDGESSCIAKMCGACCTDAACVLHKARAEKSAQRLLKLQKENKAKSMGRKKGRREKKEQEKTDVVSPELARQVLLFVYQQG